MTCYLCTAPSVPGPGDVPLCAKCRAGDGEVTPRVETTFKGEDVAVSIAGRPVTSLPIERYLTCGTWVTGSTWSMLEAVEAEHRKSCVPCMRAQYPLPPAVGKVLDDVEQAGVPAILDDKPHVCVGAGGRVFIDDVEVSAADYWRPVNPEKAAAHDAFFKAMQAELDAGKKYLEEKWANEFYGDLWRYADRDEAESGDGSEDEE